MEQRQAIDSAQYGIGGPFGVFQPLDVLTMLGFVILIGTVVNNPILIVDRALQLVRYEGAEPIDAILEAVRSRIRPIFMTTFTTVLGLLPLVIFPGAGSELYRGLGSVLLGGLLVSDNGNGAIRRLNVSASTTSVAVGGGGSGALTDSAAIYFWRALLAALAPAPPARPAPPRP